MTIILDAKGLKCPLPVLRARKAMKEVAPGGLLQVLATDPGAVKDFAHFCETTGHALVEHEASARAPTPAPETAPQPTDLDAPATPSGAPSAMPATSAQPRPKKPRYDPMGI